MDHYLERMERALFVKKLAFYYSEINALHPFREGSYV